MSVVKVFPRNINSRHLRTHTNERPYTCINCDSTFSRKQHLTSHLRTHTGEKPFSCDVCEKLFICRRNLNQHKQTHIHNTMQGKWKWETTRLRTLWDGDLTQLMYPILYFSMFVCVCVCLSAFLSATTAGKILSKLMVEYFPSYDIIKGLWGGLSLNGNWHFWLTIQWHPWCNIWRQIYLKRHAILSHEL